MICSDYAPQLQGFMSERVVVWDVWRHGPWPLAFGLWLDGRVDRRTDVPPKVCCDIYDPVRQVETVAVV